MISTLSRSLQVPFVPTTAGVLLPPSALYDPRNADFVALLDGDSAFPAGQFADPKQVRLHHNIT